MPEELQLNPSLFKYPDISELIMKDPSPKAKKKGKKGKKKKWNSQNCNKSGPKTQKIVYPSKKTYFLHMVV